MKKLNYILGLISIVVMTIPHISAVGGGLALHRYNAKNELEFLLVKDATQRHAWRQGFEFPAGTIGDYGHRTIDGFDEAKIDILPLAQKKDIPAIRYLRGAVREALEELVFVPAMRVVPGSAYNSHHGIDKTFEKQAIDTVSDAIVKQGLICLRSVTEKSNYNIFFLDVTNLQTQSFLQDIESQRRILTAGWFSKPGAIGAEPDEFAWVKAAELVMVIDQVHEKESDHVRVTGVYSVVASEHIKQHGSLQTNKRIKLSPGFVGLIRNSTRGFHNQGDGQASSMSAIITALNKPAS